jgi:hypothetical protein
VKDDGAVEFRAAIYRPPLTAGWGFSLYVVL